MSHAIQVERDVDGLQQAVRSLFEEALVKHRMASAIEHGSPSQLARLEAEIPVREISPGYFRRAGYLIELSNMLELGIPLEPSSITPTDVLGIRAVRTARAEYERDHPACPQCAERQDNRHMRLCVACGYQLRGERH